jgi:hypothetical protein
VTTFTVRHHAGSQEGAIFQRNAFGKAMEAAGADVVGAVTVPGDAGGEAVRRLMEADDA